MSDTKPDEPDVFVANNTYPDAKGLFYDDYESLEGVRDTCVVVLDTNALLVPYGIGKSSLSQIESTYRPLVEEGRLVVPGQVAREFARNRPVKIAGIFQALNRKRNIASPDKGRYPLLEDAPGYAKLRELEDRIDELVGEYRETIGDLLSHIRCWNWDDPVSTLYSRLFPDVVLDPTLSEDAIRDQLQYQHVNKLPPGYKDAAKADQGVGDHLVWQVVVQVAQERKQPVVLVSGDSKADWFYRSENQPLFPRFELVDELRRVSGGKSLHIVSFAKFLQLFGATAEAVGEVRKEEIKVDLSTMSRDGRAALTAHLAEQAVAHWLRRKYPGLDVSRDERSGDYVWSDPGGASILVSVKYFRATTSGGLVRHRLRHELNRFESAYAKKDWPFDNILVFLVFESATAADSAAEDLAAGWEQQQGQVAVAHLSKDGSLRVQDPLSAFSDLE